MSTQHAQVLIIGAGLSGIGIACRLRRDLPDVDLAILERRERLGGTWDLFRYPGIRSDNDMFSYGYEFRPWQDPTVLGSGSTIRDYLASTAREFGVHDDIRYGLKVINADWSSQQRRWTVTAKREATGEIATWTCSFLVACTGYYNYDRGYLPDFPGASAFRGALVHPQVWPEDLDLTGKRVVIIGSGATAVTLAPALASQAAHVTLLQRSPSYVLSVPTVDRILRLERKFLPETAAYRRARKRAIWLQRAIFLISRRFPAATRRLLLARARRALGRDFDMSHFSPRYAPWDERLCIVPDNDLFTALREGRASMVTGTIETFTPTGIRLASGSDIEADVIVTATGLELQLFGGASLSVDGVERRPQDCLTYKGVMLEGIPNLVVILGYVNAPFTLKVDLTAAYLVRLLAHMAASGHTVVTPVDREGNNTGAGLVDDLPAGYFQRGKSVVPRQGRELPWLAVLDYKHDRSVLLTEPIDDGIVEFSD